MRKKPHYILYILIVCTALLNIQCNGKKKMPLPELVQAESVMFDHPDSALHILESMPMPSARRDKENHALWCLLTTQAQYKLVMKIPSDSLVRIAYDYYNATDNARRKAMAALYMGNINYNLGNIEEALGYYLEGKTEIEKTEDYKTGYLIMSSLGKLYLYRNLSDYALESCTQAYNYAVKDSNKRYQMGGLQYLARCYCISNKLPQAIESYQQCSAIAIELGLKNTDYYYDIQHEIALVYANNHEIEKSLSILQSFPVEYRSFSLIGKNYFCLGELDSTFYYLNKALDTDNIYTKESIYKYLYKLSENSKYNKYLKIYCDSLLFYNDSIIAMDKGKEIIAYKEKYDHQRLINEQQRLKLEKAETQRILIVVTLCLVMLVAITIYLYQKRLVRKETTIRCQSEQLQTYMLQLHENESRLMQNRQYMQELKTQLAAHEDDADIHREQQEQMDRLEAENSSLQTTILSLQQRIGEYSSRLSNARKDMDQLRNLSEEALQLRERERQLTDRLVDRHPLMAELQSRSRTLSEEEWQELVQLCDDTWDGFTVRLQRLCPQLTDQELRLCLLIRLRLSNAQQAAIFAVSPASVSQKKFRLKKHLQEAGAMPLSADTSLDRWLCECRLMQM